MPPPIQKLAEGYMYDPTTISITPKTLTVDAIQQAYVEVPAKEKAGAPGRAAEDRRTRAGDHLHPDQNRRLEAGEDAEGQRPRREGAARRPQPGRSATEVMISFKDHRVKLLVATDIAARGSTSTTSPTSSTTTSRTPPRPTSTASAAPAGSGGPAARSPS
jgi:ATP-dependent RNA helicase DeaD